MLINCWILNHVCTFLNKTFRWFKYVCIKKVTCKTFARFHSLTGMSRDRDHQDRTVPWPKWLRPNRPDRKVLFRKNTGMDGANAASIMFSTIAQCYDDLQSWAQFCCKMWGGEGWCKTNVVIGPMRKWSFVNTDSQSCFSEVVSKQH